MGAVSGRVFTIEELAGLTREELVAVLARGVGAEPVEGLPGLQVGGYLFQELREPVGYEQQLVDDPVGLRLGQVHGDLPLLALDRVTLETFASAAWNECAPATWNRHVGRRVHPMAATPRTTPLVA